MLKPLLLWDSESENDHPSLVWRTKLDDRYLVEVQRDPTDGYRGKLVVFDHNKNDEEIALWDVGLSYGARFGPDVADVGAWEEKVIDFIDNTYSKKQ